MRPSGVNSDMERGRSVPCKTDRHNEETSCSDKNGERNSPSFLPTIRYGRQTDELQESSEGLRQRGTARSKVIRKTACRRICHRPSSCEHNAGNANIHKSKSSCDEGPQLLPPSRKVPPARPRRQESTEHRHVEELHDADHVPSALFRSRRSNESCGCASSPRPPMIRAVGQKRSSDVRDMICRRFDIEKIFLVLGHRATHIAIGDNARSDCPCSTIAAIPSRASLMRDNHIAERHRGRLARHGMSLRITSRTRVSKRRPEAAARMEHGIVLGPEVPLADQRDGQRVAHHEHSRRRQR